MHTLLQNNDLLVMILQQAGCANVTLVCQRWRILYRRYGRYKLSASLQVGLQFLRLHEPRHVSFKITSYSIDRGHLELPAVKYLLEDLECKAQFATLTFMENTTCRALNLGNGLLSNGQKHESELQRLQCRGEIAVVAWNHLPHLRELVLTHPVTCLKFLNCVSRSIQQITLKTDKDIDLQVFGGCKQLQSLNLTMLARRRTVQNFTALKHIRRLSLTNLEHAVCIEEEFQTETLRLKHCHQVEIRKPKALKYLNLDATFFKTPIVLPRDCDYDADFFSDTAISFV